MLSPKEIQAMSSDLIQVYTQIEDDLLVNIARRMADVDKIEPDTTADWQLRKLNELGALRKENIQTIKKYSGKTMDSINRILNDAGFKALEFDEAIYEEAHSKGLLENMPKPARASPTIKQIIQGAIDNTRSSFNLINTTALQSAQDGFLRIVNQSYLESSLGISDLTTAVRKGVRSLADMGITGADYISAAGRHTRNNIDVAVRRAIVTSTSQTAGDMQIQRAKEWGSNLVEVTSHGGARPSHARWQGKIYSLDGETREYPNLVRATDYGSVTGLKGANCSHDFYPYFPGISRQTYFPVDEEENAQIYEQSQQQRKLERDIRFQKRRVLTADAAGDADGKLAAQLSLKDKEAKLNKFIDETGRTKRSNRQQVLGFSHSEASSASWAKRKQQSIISGGYSSSSVAQKTIGEAENWAKGVLGVKEANYKGQSLSVVNAVNKSLNSIFKQYPILNGFVDKIEFKDISSVASASLGVRNGEIYTALRLSPSEFANIKKINQMISQEVSQKFWSPKDGASGIIKHESAHLAEYALTLKKYGVYKTGSSLTDIRAAVSAIKSGEISTAVRTQALRACNLPDSNAIIEQNLSKYATSNSSEFLAEALSEHNPRRLARTAIKIFNDLLGRY